MYQITGNSVSFRVNDEERNSLNDFATRMQIADHQRYSNSKQVVFALIEYCKQLENKLNSLNTDLSMVNTDVNSNEDTTHTELNTDAHTIENEENAVVFTEISEMKSKLIELIGYKEPITDDALYSDLIDIISTPLEPAPTVEIEKTIEVEKPLEPNQVLLNLAPSQKGLIEKISRWRSFKKLDSETHSVESTIKRMVFNVGTLTNDHGYFETGINDKKLKKG